MGQASEELERSAGRAREIREAVLKRPSPTL